MLCIAVYLDCNASKKQIITIEGLVKSLSLTGLVEQLGKYYVL